MLNHRILARYNFSHLCHSLFPLSLSMHIVRLFHSFLYFCLLEWIHQMQFDTSLLKVHTYRRSHIITFFMVEMGIHNTRLQNHSGKFSSFMENCLPKYLEHSNLLIFEKWSQLAWPALYLWKNFLSRGPWPSREKNETGFLNKWISPK